MLPGAGFFRDIDCPYYESSCVRPYCHFKHRKKVSETDEAPTLAAPDVPVYNPTPKSQLASVKSHIPISYVPDLAVSTKRSTLRAQPFFRYGEKPTYKPTPLSMLPSVRPTESDDKKSDGVEEDSVEQYNPVDDCEIDFEGLESEFNMIDEIMNDTEGEGATNEEESKSVEAAVQPNEAITEKETKLAKESKSSKHSRSKASNKSESKGKSRSHSNSSSKSKSNSNIKSQSKHKHKSSKSDKGDKARKDTKKVDTKSSKEKRHSSKHTSSTERNKHKHSSKEKHKSKIEEIKINEDLMNNHSDDVDDCDIAANSYYNSDDDSDQDETLRECYRIFTEYKPTEPDIFAGINEDVPVIKEAPQETIVGKKRIAHENAAKAEPKIVSTKPKVLHNAAQAMMNRIKAARLAQANNEQNNIINEINRQMHLKRPLNSPEEPKKILKTARPSQSKITNFVTKKPVETPSTSTSIVDDIIGGKSTSAVKIRRIAPVQNVGSIQRAKERIQEMVKVQAAKTFNKTTCQTLSKGGKRVAHVPEAALVNIPDVFEAENSKLPVNVRSRFLKMLVDECGKLYAEVDDAHQRALSEEFKCYERCSALITYKNSSMLAVSRLRKELQERQAAGLGPILPGESVKVVKDDKCELKGKRFYENIKKHILSEEELVLHGFPREGTGHGRAIVTSQRKVVKGFLGEHDRVCCRCSKMYKIDKEGFALYDEECIYHPLRKRTFRGESIYLCCKTNTDTGCATAPSHVFEGVYSDSTELEGFQMTLPAESDDDPRSYEVFALDCEMCYTTKGLELTRITIINSECKTVYETLVKPFNSIIDYNTRFSGITEEQMNRTATSILQVQANILHLCNSNTILIGHSLESDMKALKIIHKTIIDTSVLFPHKFGLPHKRALRDLAREYLKKIIQNDVSGHDSAEDALSCMELVQWKLKEELKARGVKL